MVGHNGNYCAFKQYMLLKPITHGIKLWILANSLTKFVWNIEVYIGARNKRRIGLPQTLLMGTGDGVVTCFTTGMEGLFYWIAMDNYFSSAKLFENLLQRGFYALGIVRSQQKGFSSSLNIKRQETCKILQLQVHRDCQMAAIHWQNTKGVHFLSTSKDPMVQGGVSVLHNKDA